MKKYRIGVLCPSEIAFRRFMPALLKQEQLEYVGIASANEIEWFGEESDKNNKTIIEVEKEKARKFIDTYGGKQFNSYRELIESSEVDIIYIPLPPALHYKWAKECLLNNKNVFVEKPSTTSFKDTEELVNIARSKGLVFRENYMFIYHNQIDYVDNVIKEGTLGDLRLIRISFGFPFRGANDFRYNKKLGGGALLDCGGYTLKLAGHLLGKDAKLKYHKLNYVDGFDVDIYGSATLENDKGAVAQVSFGMDNSYKCELEVWGSKGVLFTDRILTAPNDFKPTMVLKVGNEITKQVLDEDDSFFKSIDNYVTCLTNVDVREEEFQNLLSQAQMVDTFKED